MRFLRLIFLSLIFVSFLSCQKSPEKKNVIFILIDTLRADHLSMNGYERNTTPNIDAFAKESINFSNAFSPAPWTPVAMASIFTGLYPSAHGMLPPSNLKGDAKAMSYRLHEKLYTLSEMYKDNGYRTLAVQTNPWLNTGFGFTQGFDKVVYKHKERAKIVNKDAIALLDKYKKSKNKAPFFLYLHYFDPHGPYHAPRQYKELYKQDLKDKSYTKEAEELIRRYDREIKYTDDKLGELFSYFKKSDLYDNSIIVVMADHGEQFFEHGEHGHGKSIFNQEIKVPFFIRTDGKSQIVDTPVSTLDLFETLITLSSLKNNKSQTQGFSLVTKEGLNKRKRTSILSEVRKKHIQTGIVNNEQIKLVLDYKGNVSDKDIEEFKSTNARVFDLKRDLLEQNHVNDELLNSKLKKDFSSLYHKILQGKIKQSENDKVQMDDKTVKELKSLGYL